MPRQNVRAVEGEINRLRSLTLEELRREWRRLYRGDAPKLSRDLLVLALGYRLQEIEHGGLGKATRRKLQTIAKITSRNRASWLRAQPQPEAGNAARAGVAGPYPYSHGH
jgi:Protein of unknown function (DUF2924)